MDEFLERVETEYNPAVSRVLSSLPRPETRPPFSRIVRDTEGNIWASEYVQLEYDPQRWTVFSPDGNLIGDVVVPERFRIFDIGSDFILGRYQDDLDVEHVRVYRLSKDEGGSLVR